MGEVYLVQHPRLPRQDALKVLRANVSADPDFLERFNREADLVAKLWHPHIVGIHDRGKYRGRLWISMDLVDGTDVGRMLDEQYPDGMPSADAIEIIKAVASALDYAHAKGLLHRDVKPANILIADAEHGDRRILLSDFGVARDLSDTTSGGLTATNMTVGTAAYAAPEQLMGLAVDGRTDQYSLAATAYHLLVGTPMFQNSNPAVVIGQHLNVTPAALAGSHPELASLDAAMSRALAKDPEARFATCMEFARALETPEHRAEETLTTPSLNAAATMARPAAAATVMANAPSDPAAVPPERHRRVAWLALAAAVLAAVVIVVAYFALAPAGDDTLAEPFTLAGTVRLSGDVVKTSGLPGGYKCAGAKDYGDLGPDAPVTIENESGKLLAKGAIESSSGGLNDACLLMFRVDEVPGGAQFYRVHVAQHPEMSYTEAEAKKGVELAMGTSKSDPEPTTATAAPSPKPPPQRTPTRTVTVTPDVETNSLSQLRAIAADDRSDVLAYLADTWIPQISSKRVGLEAEGTVWDNAQILDEHLQLRQEYHDVKLLWSGDWSTFDGRNFWVTVVGLKSPYYPDVLAWCSEQGFDRNNCIAKMVSTWRPVEGTTKLMN